MNEPKKEGKNNSSNVASTNASKKEIAQNNKKQEKPKFSKKNILWIFLLLMLLSVLVIVPVGKIPLLRNLAYAMGYNQEETKSISFLRALVSWTEHAKEIKQEKLKQEKIYAFSGDKIKEQKGKLENKLINIKALNAQLKKEGKDVEGVKGSYYRPPSEAEENHPSEVTVTNSSATAGTQANSAEVGEVYFGTDTSTVLRNTKDGYNSVNTLKKVQNPTIAGASSRDGLGILIDKAVMLDAGLSNLSRNLDKNGMLAQLGANHEIGDSKAQKDMYYAWLMGKAINHTHNVVLKKTLASASFEGADMPQTVFTALGSAGIGIEPNDVAADIEKVKKYLKDDTDCKGSVTKWDSDNLDDVATNTKNTIKSVSTYFDNKENPLICKNLNVASLNSQIGSISSGCETIRKGYDLLNSCNVKTYSGTCNANSLTNRIVQYSTYCEDEKKKCDELTDEQAKADCVQKAENKTEKECENCTENQKSIYSYFDQTSGFFSDVDWSDFKRRVGYTSEDMD